MNSSNQLTTQLALLDPQPTTTFRALDQDQALPKSHFEFPSYSTTARTQVQVLKAAHSSEKLNQQVIKWLLFDAQRYYDTPAQLFRQIMTFGARTLSGLSINRDPLVAIDIRNSDPDYTELTQLVENLTAGDTTICAQALNRVNSQNTTIENEYFAGVFAYELIAQELLCQTLHLPISLPTSPAAASPANGLAIKAMAHSPFFKLAQTDLNAGDILISRSEIANLAETYHLTFNFANAQPTLTDQSYLLDTDSLTLIGVQDHQLLPLRHTDTADDTDSRPMEVLLNFELAKTRQQLESLPKTSESDLANLASAIGSFYPAPTVNTVDPQTASTISDWHAVLDAYLLGEWQPTRASQTAATPDSAFLQEPHQARDDNPYVEVHHQPDYGLFVPFDETAFTQNLLMLMTSSENTEPRHHRVDHISLRPTHRLAIPDYAQPAIDINDDPDTKQQPDTTTETKIKNDDAFFKHSFD